MRKQTKLTKAARGQECQIRIPGVCNGDASTTVLCHLNGGGTGRKSNDLHAAWGCSDCHAWVDGGYAKLSTRELRDFYHLQGVIRTQEKLIEMGMM